MAKDPHDKLSRRERQIMEIVYRLGQVTVADVVASLEEPPSYSAVRASLRILEEKGHLQHQQEGPRYLYLPTISRERARQSALRNLLKNFFDNSHEQMVATLLGDASTSPSREELERLARLVDQARKEGR